MRVIIVIAASAGGLGPLVQIVAALPPTCRASVFVVQHIGANHSILPSILAWHGSLPVAFAQHGEVIERGRIYVAPPDHHMRLRAGGIWLDKGIREHFTRPAADPLFISAAETYGARVVGIVLSGANTDGATGILAITAHGGLGLVQSLDEAEFPEMPLAALKLDHPEAPLTADRLAKWVVEHCASKRLRVPGR
ncbi:chemotaxis protein CheB [Methylobacterium sp. E-025]|uniref:chemotaxis protein CheB n=1 Tax=Methylobacterium sp. E-025 TaxID=2836561 RepID=UPI001FB8BA1D|nr:chemotaxis protein CheB [Methylobacterium sp. E-025]MCJ2111554.1 chemotaxis protein CheB [Methylobacterium sp. E-025]